MLQQTQVERVVEKWKQFLLRFPTLKILASAPVRNVIKHWNGLGYNNRALRLHLCSRLIIEEYASRFPQSLDQLMTLPGIGQYTAHALACFALGQRVPVVDINVRRILSRVFIKRKNPSRIFSERHAWKIAFHVLPRKNYYEWNQALMDLGSTICTATSPQCRHCPLIRVCRSANIISQPSKRRMVRKSEPMCGNVPRRLVRGKIVQYLRTAGNEDGIRIEMILSHLRGIYSGIYRHQLNLIINQLTKEGLVIVHRKTSSGIFVSLP